MNGWGESLTATRQESRRLEVPIEFVAQGTNDNAFFIENGPAV